MSLFVSEDEGPGSDFEQETRGDDPVVQEIPIHLAANPSLPLYLLQYPTKTHPNGGVSEARLKPESGIVELDLPMDTTRFFDPTKSEEWNSVKTQTVKGVLNDSNNYYMGIFKDGKLMLNYIEKTAQLRPSFKYIDQAKKAKEMSAIDVEEEAPKKAKEVHVVQTTLKTNGTQTSRLGGALQCNKKEEEEEFQKVDWVTSHEVSSELANGSNEKLESNVSKQDFAAAIF